MQDQRFGRRELLTGAGLTAGLSAGLLSGKGPLEAAEPSLVPTKELGTTGVQVPILMQGCGESFDMSYSKILHGGLREGVYYLDCAQVYEEGKSHRSVGVFLKQIDDRSKHFVTSKVFLAPKAASPERYSKPVKKILPELGVDSLDMFFMHDVRDAKILESEYIKMGQKLKRKGLTKFFGFSCHDGNVVQLMNKAAKIGTAGIDAIMFRYSFAEYGDLQLNKAIDACKKAGIGLIAMKTQASVPADQKEVQRFQSEKFTLGQAKLKAVWADERIDGAVSHMVTTHQLRDNVAAAKSEAPLEMSELQQLMQYAARTAHQRCGGCNRICESRIDGDVRVSDTLRYLMYDESYGRTKEARRLYRALSPSEREFDSLDLREAMTACPRSIDIPKRLAEARARLA